MIRRRSEDPFFEAPAGDTAEQHQPVDPLETAEPDTSTSRFLEADPVDAAEQAESVTLDDELRAEPMTWSECLANPPAEE